MFGINPKKNCGRYLRAGFTMIEVVFAMFILMLMALMFAVVVPTSARSTRYASDYAQASSVVMHKLNQVQDAGYANMDGPGLGGSGALIVDGSPSTPANNDNGDQTFTAEFTDRDKLWEYFSGGRDASGNRITSGNIPRGYLYVSPYAPSAITSGSTTTYSLVRVTATVQWWNAKGQLQTFSATTLVPKTTVN